MISWSLFGFEILSISISIVGRVRLYLDFIIYSFDLILLRPPPTSGEDDHRQEHTTGQDQTEGEFLLGRASVFHLGRAGSGGSFLFFCRSS